MLGGSHKGSMDGSDDGQSNPEVPTNGTKFFSICLKLRQDNKI